MKRKKDIIIDRNKLQYKGELVVNKKKYFVFCYPQRYHTLFIFKNEDSNEDFDRIKFNKYYSWEKVLEGQEMFPSVQGEWSCTLINDTDSVEIYKPAVILYVKNSATLEIIMKHFGDSFFGGKSA